MKIIITGGAGFIGSSLTKKLMEREDVEKIFIIDNFQRDSTKFFQFNDKVKIIKLDLTNYDGVVHIFSHLFGEHDIDSIIHLSALCGVDNVIHHPVRTMEVNIIGTYNILKFLSNGFKIKKFINFSTSEVYGSYSFKLGEYEKTTLGAVGEARWGYSVSKLASEHLMFAYQKEFGIPSVSVRPFNIYGPGQIGEGAIQTFILKCLIDEKIQIHGDGSQIRSWCYIDDAIDFIEKIIDNDTVNGHVLNMGNPEGTITIVGLAKKIIKLTNSNSKLEFIPNPNEDVELRIPNIEKAKKMLDFEPKVSLDEGIIKTYNWFKDQRDNF